MRKSNLLLGTSGRNKTINMLARFYTKDEASFKIWLLNLKVAFEHDFLMPISPNVETYFNFVQLNTLQMKYKKLNFKLFFYFF